jgi:hypothetical protein
LRQDSSPIGYLTKPEKLYLHNTALAWALSINREPETGSLRETFFLNQAACKHRVTLPKNGDFMVDNKFTFEIGGPNKNKTANRNTPQQFCCAGQHRKRGSGQPFRFGFLDFCIITTTPERFTRHKNGIY